MISTHNYATLLLGTPNRALGMRGGSITLDDTAAPHVQASVDVSIPDASLLGLLDPRTAARVRIDVTATSAFGTQSRTFNLGIRSRQVKHREAVVTLNLASDEAMLDDYAPLTDSSAPYAYQHSIRALVDYVLGVAIPGTSLAAGGPDPSIRVPVSSVNLVKNPRAKTDLTEWSTGQAMARVATGGPAGSPTYVRTASSSAGTLLVAHSEGGVPIEAGKRYRISVFQQADAGVMLGVDGIVYSAANAQLLDIIETPQAATGIWSRRTVEFTAPASASKLRLRSFTTTSVPANRSLDTTGWRVSEITDDPTDTGYYDGDTTDTADYDYAYNGATSTRIALVDRASDLLFWPAGVSALDFLAPILQTLGLRLVCNEARSWTLRDASFVAPGSLAIRHGINLVDGDDEITRDESEYFDAAVIRYQWRDRNGTQQQRIDSFALTTPPTQVRAIERNAAYPGPGFAEYAVRRAQGRGRQVTVTAVSDWNAHAEQPTEYTLLGAPVQLGKTSRIVFNLDRDEMTVTSRTTDTVIGAIDLLPGVIDALAGTIDNL